MAKYTLIAIIGLIVFLLGLLALLSGIGQFQADSQFEGKLSEDRSRYEQLNATGGYQVCAYSNQTGTLNCPDNPYTGSLQWIGGGLLAVGLGAGAIYYDVEERA